MRYILEILIILTRWIIFKKKTCYDPIIFHWSSPNPIQYSCIWFDSQIITIAHLDSTLVLNELKHTFATVHQNILKPNLMTIRWLSIHKPIPNKYLIQYCSSESIYDPWFRNQAKLVLIWVDDWKTIISEDWVSCLWKERKSKNVWSQWFYFGTGKWSEQ